jgi:hypothetical protein
MNTSFNLLDKTNILILDLIGWKKPSLRLDSTQKWIIIYKSTHMYRLRHEAWRSLIPAPVLKLKVIPCLLKSSKIPSHLLFSLSHWHHMDVRPIPSVRPYTIVVCSWHSLSSLRAEGDWSEWTPSLSPLCPPSHPSFSKMARGKGKISISSIHLTTST